MMIHLPCKDCQALVPVQIHDVRAIDIVTVLCETCLSARVTQVKAERQPANSNPSPPALSDEPPETPSALPPTIPAPGPPS